MKSSTNVLVVATATALAIAAPFGILESRTAVAKSQIIERTTMHGCGAGIGHDSIGSSVVQWFPEVNIWRPSSGLPVRHAWLLLLNPTMRDQSVTVTGIEMPRPAVEGTLSVVVGARTRMAIDLGEHWWVARSRVDMGLEVRWQTYGAATVSMWNADYSAQIIVPATIGCYEAWPANPYGGE
jgi:hypothetical protein